MQGSRAILHPSLTLVLTLGLILAPQVAEAVYRNRFTDTTAGAITFTGNSLGLAKAKGVNAPGTNDAIGTFTSTDLTSRDGTAWPLGTTADWRLSSSSAELRLPPGAQVLHAELIWGGSWAEAAGQENVEADLDTPVTLITPLGAMVSVTPLPLSVSGGKLGATTPPALRCTGGLPCQYMRSADVTDQVAPAGAGTYTVGGVPGTQSNGDETNNAAGWTLAVAYRDPSRPVSNLTIFTGAERGGDPPAQVSGFCTPSTGALEGRLAVSAVEGDANKTGDQMLFGPTTALGAANRLSGPRNNATNFFASQIADDQGALDVLGTFGTMNHTPGSPGTNVSGARQGWDITNVDASAQLVNSQTSAFAQGTTSGDQYTIGALGLQIEVGAPLFRNPSLSVDKPATFVGDVLTYTLVLDNTQGTAPADNVVAFDDALPPGTSFLPGTVTVNGTPQPAANIIAGVPVGTIVDGPAGVVTVTYQAMVNSVPASPAVASYVNDARWTFDYVQCAGQDAQNLEITSNMVTTLTPRIEAVKEASPTTISPGQATTFRITISNTGTAPSSGTTLTDTFPKFCQGGTTPGAACTIDPNCGGGADCVGLSFVRGTAQLNLAPIPEPPPPTVVTGFEDFPVNAPGPVDFTGQIPAGQSAVVTFQLSADPAAAGTITNVATVDPDGPGGPVPPLPPTSVPITVTPTADLVITKVQTPQTAVSPGETVTYTLTVTNNGPSAATDVVVTDPTPANLTFVSNAGACATPFPCMLGALAAGATVTITSTFTVNDPTVPPPPTVTSNTATVTSPVEDPVPGNNTSTVQTSIEAPVTVLSVTKDDTVTEVVPGSSVTYTIIVSNAGPDPADGAHVTDMFPPALLNPTWTCTGSAGASCPASGSGNIDVDVTIPAGGNVTFTATGQVDPEATGQLPNTVTGTPPPNSGDPTPTEATDVDELTPQADVRVVKTGPATVTPGGMVTYQVQVVNDGPSVANDVSVLDPTPTGLTLVSVSGACTAFPCDLGTVPSGTTQAITATYRVAPDLPTPGSITNTASVLASTPDPNTGNNTSNVPSTVMPEADVVVTKTPAGLGALGSAIPPGSITPGTTAQYVITVANLGPSIATAVVVDDPAPQDLTFVSASAPCTGGFPCMLGDMPPGASQTITVAFSVPSSLTAPGTLENTATANSTATPTTPATPDPDSSNNTSTTTQEVFGVADIAVDKTVNPPSAVVGQTVTYTISASNLGPSDASAVVANDVLPAQLTLQGATPSAGTYDAATGTWTIGDLAVGQAVTLTITATVNVDGQINNTVAKTGSNQRDPNPSNDTAGALLNAMQPGDVGVDVSVVDGDSPAPGDSVEFAITLTNRGPSPATGVTVPPQFICEPAGTPLMIVSASPTQGTFDGTTWDVGALAVDQTPPPTLNVVVVIPEGCDTIRSQAGQSHTEPDTNRANDTDSAVITPVGPTLEPEPPPAPPPPADIQLTKSPSNTTPQLGEPITYTVTVRNNGPGSADGVMVLEPLPAGLTLLPADQNPVKPSKGTFDAGTGLWTVGALAVSESQTLALSVVVGTSGTIVNTASLSASTPPDPNPDNNVATSTLQVPGPPQQEADVSITKTASAPTVQIGEQLTWTLTVSNAGPGPATDVVVTDDVPTQVTIDSATASQGTCQVGAGQVTCMLGEVAVGATATVTIVATRTAPAAFSNTAAVSTGSTDPNPANNTSTVQTGPAGVEDCGNCIDDDGDGLVDAEDPDCCAAQPLTVTMTRRLRGKLQVKGRLGGGTFAGIDPRQEDVQLVLRDAQGEVTCCAVPREQWRKVLGRVNWARGLQGICPPVKSLCLIVPKQGPTRTVINTSPQTQTPLDITLSAGEQCVRGQTSSVRSRARGREVSR